MSLAGNTAPDTSVLVAAMSPWHPDHDPCRRFLASRPASIAHVLVETYSVLTRLPAPQRVAPTVAADAIRRACAKSPATLPASAIAPLLSRLAHMGISGGATYDALIAETARKHGITLYSLDRRARVTYDAVGADVVWIGTPG